MKWFRKRTANPAPVSVASLTPEASEIAIDCIRSRLSALDGLIDEQQHAYRRARSDISNFENLISAARSRAHDAYREENVLKEQRNGLLLSLKSLGAE